MGSSPKRKGGPIARPPAKRSTAISKSGPALAARHHSDIKRVYDAYTGLQAADATPSTALKDNFQRVLDGSTGMLQPYSVCTPPP